MGSDRGSHPAALIRRLRPLSFETRILRMAFAVGLPGTAAALLLLWLGPYSPRIQVLVTVALAVAWWWLAESVWRSVVRPLQTMSNLLHAVRGRAPGALPPAPMVAVNAEYATLDDPVRLGDEVAIIPPVAGG